MPLLLVLFIILGFIVAAVGLVWYYTTSEGRIESAEAEVDEARTQKRIKEAEERATRILRELQ